MFDNIGIKPETEKFMKDLFEKCMAPFRELVTTLRGIDKSLKGIDKSLQNWQKIEKFK